MIASFSGSSAREHPAALAGDADRHDVVAGRGRSRPGRCPRRRRTRRARCCGRRRRRRRRMRPVGLGVRRRSLIAERPYRRPSGPGYSIACRSPRSPRRDPRLALAPATVAVSAGRPPRQPDGPMNPPIVMASTYHAGGEVGYGRYGNPTWEMLESALGALEGGVATSFASGMAAVAAVLDLVPARRHRRAPRRTPTTARSRCSRALEDAGRLRRPAGRPDRPRRDRGRASTGPTCLGRVADQPAAARWSTCRRWRGGPGGRRPARRSTARSRRRSCSARWSSAPTVVVHSATKYLSGHSDLLLGAGGGARPRPGRAPRRAPQRRGGVPGAVRGLARAARPAHPAPAGASGPRPTPPSWLRRLARHPGVTRVHYPGIGGDGQRRARRDAAAADRPSSPRRRLWVHATSLGGVESSLERRRRWAGESTEVPETLLRLSVGVEDVEDLWGDLGERAR